MPAAEVVEKRVLTPVVRHVQLRITDQGTFAFQSGQFIQFVLAPRILRQFSIASEPSTLPYIDLCVDVSPGGHGSMFIEGLQPHDPVTFRGPFGVFVVPPEETRPLEFVATGAGIAPIRSMIGALFNRAAPAARPIVLTFGNRTPEDILYHREWKSLAEHQPTFRYVPTLSRPPAGWAGERGRVTGVLRVREDLLDRAFFICGAPAMVDDMREVLAGRGVAEKDIHFEKFT